MSKLFPIHPLAALLLITILAACSSSQPFYLDSDYREAKVESPVLILPLERHQFENFYEHTFGTLSGNEKRAFDTQLESLFRQYAGTTAYLNEDEELEKEEFEILTLDMNGDSIELLVPKAGTDAVSAPGDVRFLLLLDQFTFREASETVGGSSYAGHEGSQEKSYLHFETKYVYWDRETEQPVGWGVARGKTEVGEGNIASEHYATVLSQAMERIAKNGPVGRTGR